MKALKCSTWLGIALSIGLVAAGCGKSESDASESSSATAAKPASSGGGLSSLFSSSKKVAIPAGTDFAVVLNHTISTKEHKSGDDFDASLASPIIVNGQTVIPKGATVRGQIVEARESGRLKGTALLRLKLTSVEVDGKSYDLDTETISSATKGHGKRNAILIGGGAGLGAAIGAIAGGGKGAAIGAAAGAGAGTATAAATGKQNIVLPAESRLEFRLEAPVEVSVKG
jgi:hypothetical protein